MPALAFIKDERASASMKKLTNRGAKTVELPFLMSCALHLLSRRYWLIGLRYAWYGVEFDLVVRDPSANAHVVLVECKFRSGGRKIRPSDVENFRERLARASSSGSYYGRGFFMANTTFSEKALELCKEYGIRPFIEVPELFELKDCAEGRSKRLISPEAAAPADHSP